jgi:hypothetical protein
MMEWPFTIINEKLNCLLQYDNTYSLFEFLSDLQPSHSQTYDALVEAKELSGKPTSYRLSFDWQ